jgi:hypothetical protein
MIIASLVESFLRATWNKFYFKTGIPIFIKNISVAAHHTNIPSHILFEKKFKSNWFDFYRSLIFKELDINTYGFRGRLFGLLEGSAVYGVLIFDNKNHKVVIKCFLNWGVSIFLLIMIIIVPLELLFGFVEFYEPTWLEAFFYFGALFINLGIYYYFEYVRLSAIGEYAVLSWSRKHVNSTEG